MRTIPYEIISLLKNTKPPSILMQFPELLEISAQPVPGLPVHISTMTMAFLEFNKILNDSCIKYRSDRLTVPLGSITVLISLRDTCS